MIEAGFLSCRNLPTSTHGPVIDDIKEMRANPAREITVALQGDEERHRSSFLYALASLLRYRPLSLIKQVKGSNGLEAFERWPKVLNQPARTGPEKTGARLPR